MTTVQSAKVPSSWEEIHACGCEACRAMAETHDRCMALKEWLCVWDHRMYGAGFTICDVRKCFVEPALIEKHFPTVKAAAARVLQLQRHCDAVLSSWPLKPGGGRDFIWRRHVCR